MFWKSVKNLPLKSLSLVTKLMLLYIFSTIALLSTICIFLYPTFMRILEHAQGTSVSNLSIECFEKIIMILLITSLAAIVLGHMISSNGLKRLR